MSDLYLGIDTSNYKTSAAVTDSCNRIIYERSEYLDVPAGSRGLRQSDAFFMHSNRLPSFIEEVFSALSEKEIAAVGVSSRPRRVEGSYMPCFLAGLNSARTIGAALGIPVYQFSHQEGHAAAIIEDERILTENDFAPSLLFHLSGGTTEFLLCRPDSIGYETEIIGGTRDISFGQLIDRTGVAMGLPFPAGAYLDKIASEYEGSLTPQIPRIKFDAGHFNLSGPETAIMRMIEDAPDELQHAVVKQIFDAVADLLYKAASELSREHSARTVYMAGGVASSSYIRNKIDKTLTGSSHNDFKIIFGRPSLSGDNAAGIAMLARRLQENQ